LKKGKKTDSQRGGKGFVRFEGDHRIIIGPQSFKEKSDRRKKWKSEGHKVTENLRPEKNPVSIVEIGKGSSGAEEKRAATGGGKKK